MQNGMVDVPSLCRKIDALNRGGFLFVCLFGVFFLFCLFVCFFLSGLLYVKKLSLKMQFFRGVNSFFKLLFSNCGFLSPASLIEKPAWKTMNFSFPACLVLGWICWLVFFLSSAVKRLR